MESSNRLEKIANYIIANHKRKTHNQEFTAMFCVSSVDTLIKYYDIFEEKKEAGKHNLRIATIFSYTNNEDGADADGFIPEELSVVEEPAALYGLHMHNREKLDEYIGHYNQLFGTKFSTKDSESFYNYYNDISKKVKNREIDILLVVNMFLTGFDSPGLNTLYVDKNLKYHGLIQAYSRTNRIENERKSQGNIVVFRNLKSATDQAITLFSNKEAVDIIIMGPLDNYIKKFNGAVDELRSITPTVDSVNYLQDENEELAFIKAFRDLIRVKNVLTSFSDFSWDDLAMTEQTFENYKSKYLDLWQVTKGNRQKEKVSILNDVDFELELIHRDEINVAYILGLIVRLKFGKQAEADKIRNEITTLLNTEVELRSKRELIEQFIQNNLPQIKNSDDVQYQFDTFWEEEYQKALNQLIKDEDLSLIKTQSLIADYLFTERKPLRDEILDLIEGEKPKLAERKNTGDRILRKITAFMETHINDFAESDYASK